MNVDTGEIYISKEEALKKGAKIERLKMIDRKHLTARQLGLLMTGEEVKIGRNDICPCGSFKKFKKCCLNNPL